MDLIAASLRAIVLVIRVKVSGCKVLVRLVVVCHSSAGLSLQNVNCKLVVFVIFILVAAQPNALDIDNFILLLGDVESMLFHHTGCLRLLDTFFNHAPLVLGEAIASYFALVMVLLESHGHLFLAGHASVELKLLF